MHKSCTGVAQVEDQMECLHGPSQGWLILEVNCVKRLDVVIVYWTTDTFQKCPSGAKMQVTEQLNFLHIAFLLVRTQAKFQCSHE